jgi:hypothetical protein
MQWCSRERNRNAQAWIKDQQKRKRDDSKEIERARKARTIGELED